MLSVDGTCPGPADFDIVGITPGATVALIAGLPGSDLLPAGPCAGDRTDLSGIRLITTLRDADGDGRITLTPPLPGGACGVSVQVVDLASCLLTNTVVLRADRPEVELDLTPATGDLVFGDDPYWADKGYVFTANSTFDITGGSWLIDMPADGFVRLSVYDWPGLGLLARGTATYGSDTEAWLRSDLDFRFEVGQEYLVTFYTNRAESSLFPRQDAPTYGYGVDGLVSDVTGWSSYDSGDDAPEGTDSDGYLGNSWAPFQVLYVTE